METLAARIDRAGPLETAEAVVLAARLARALEGPHERGEAHGAVNPESVKISRDARGTAVLRASTRSSPSFHHQSPERLAGGDASPADDAWALGSTLYLALTGTVPFPGDTAADVAARIQLGSIAPLAVFDAGDDDLQELLQTMFHPDVAERTRSVVRVRKSLARWLAKRGIAAGPPLEIGTAESKPEVDLSSIPPPPRLPEMEDRPTIPRTARDASGVLYTFADEDTTLPRDAGPSSLAPGSLAPGSLAPSSSSRNPDAPFSSRLPPTSELLARAKAAPSREPPSREPGPGPRGALNPAELASRLRSPSVPPGGPRLNPPKVARERAARAASEPPPPVAPGSQPKPSSLRPPALPRDMAALLGEAPDSSKPSSRPPPLPSSPPSDKRSVPPLPVASEPPRSTPPPLPVSASSRPPEARKSRPPRSSRPPPDGAAKPKKRKPASEASPASDAVAPVEAPKAKSPALKLGVAVAVVAGLFAAYRLSSGDDATQPSPSASSVAPASAAPSSAAAPVAASAKLSADVAPLPSVVAPSASASPEPSSAAPPTSASSAVPKAPDGDVSACAVKLFAADSFAEGSHPSLDFVCRESDPRLGAQKVHEVLVRAGMGRTVSDGMREWAVMGWYELAAYAALRGRCCADPRPIELPPSPGTCPSMQDALSGVSASARLGTSEDAQKDALAAFRKSLSCTIKSGKAKPFGNYPRPAGGEDTAFLKTLQRTRNP